MSSQKHLSRIALALGLTTALCALQPSFAEQTTAQSDELAAEQAIAKLDISKLSAEQKVAYLAHTSRMALSYVEHARQNLQNKEADVAVKQLGEAQTLLNEVKSNTEEKMVPIFARIGFTEQFEVTDEIKQKLEGVNEHVFKGDHDKVVEIMKETGAAMAYTHAEMPLAEIITKVDVALKSIAANAIDKAEQELSQALDEVHVETFTVAAS